MKKVITERDKADIKQLEAQLFSLEVKTVRVKKQLKGIKARYENQYDIQGDLQKAKKSPK